MEHHKRKDDTVYSMGYIQHLSPEKRSKIRNAYYDFQLQTSTSESRYVISYNKSAYQRIDSLQQSQSPVKMKLREGNRSLIFNEHSEV